MRLVSAIAALALVAGTALMLATPGPVGASPSCTPEVAADGSILYAQVFDAKPIHDTPRHVKAILPKRTVGAKMYLHAGKGMTKEYLHRAAVCHMNAVDISSYKHDPLRVDGKIKSLRVYPAGGAFVIALTAQDSATGKEIWNRAKALTTEIDSVATKGKTPSNDM